MGRRRNRNRLLKNDGTGTSNYGATGETQPPTSPVPFDPSIFNEVLIENMNEPIITQIRQQIADAEADGPFPSKFKHIARSRRRPFLRTKSESDFNPDLHEHEDVRAMRERLLRSFHHHNPTFHLKRVPRFTTQQKLVLVSLCLVDFTSFCAMSILAPFFPQEATAKGVSITVSGLIFSVYALIIFLASPFMGVIVTHVGPKFLFITGVFLTGSCSILFGVLNMVENTEVFTFYCFAVRMCEALGAAAFSTACYVFVAEVFPDNMGAVLGILETFVGLGMSVGPAIGGVLYDWGGYGLPFFTLGGVMLLTLPLNFYLLPSSQFDENQDSEPKTSMWKLLKISPIIITALAVIVLSNTWGFIDPTLEPHLREFGLSAKQLGLFFLLSAVLYGLSSPVWGIIADRLTQTWVLMVIGLFFASIGLLLLGPSPIIGLPNSIWLNVVALIILGLSISMALLPTFEAMLDFSLDGGYRDDVSTYGLIAGLWSSMYSLGEVIGPTLGSTLTEHFGFPITATVMSILCMLMSILVLTYFLLFYHQPLESNLLCTRDRDKLVEISDSGISENGNGSFSSSEDESSTSGQAMDSDPKPDSQYAPSLLDTVVVEINETTPLLPQQPPPQLQPRTTALDRVMGLQFSNNYMSEPELFGLAHGQPSSTLNSNARKLSRHLTYGGDDITPSRKVNFSSQYGSTSGMDYSVSYPEILKTLSITGFGAVEV